MGVADGAKKFRNHVLAMGLIREFCRAHPDMQDAPDVLTRFYKELETRRFDRWDDVRRAFGSASHVGRSVVFNVGGNKYRVVADIKYGKARIYLTHVLTHEEYERGHWKR